MKFMKLSNGETLAYREREGGTLPLVLLHGNMTSSVHWDLLMEKLPPEFKVYAPDMRGFGQSTYNQPIRHLHDFAIDIKEWADTLNLGSFFLMGWSTGGGVALDYAAHYPNDVEKLLLMCSASTRGYPIYRKDEHGLPMLDQPLHTREEIAQDPIQVLPILHAYQERNKEMLRIIWNMLIYTEEQPDEARYEKYLEDMLTQRNLVDVDYALTQFNISQETQGPTAPGNGIVTHITMPVLVLSGKRDMVIPREMTEQTLTDLGKVTTFQHIELNSGHSPLIDDLENLVRSITTFILYKN